MAVFKVIIDGFGPLPVTPPFVPSTEINRRPNGQVQSIREVWSFRGVLPTTVGPDELRTKRTALLAAFQRSVGAVRVIKDGATFDEISPDRGYPRGAFFRNFNVRATGGEWVSLLQYEFEVVGEKPIAISGVLEATTRKTWTVERGRASVNVSTEARGPGALEFVRSTAPAGVTRSVITQIVEEDRVSGSFDADTEEEQLAIEETVEVVPGLFVIEHVRPTRAAQPVPFWSSRSPTRVRISGEMRAAPGTAIVPPVGKALARYAVDGGIRIRRSVTNRTGEGTEGKALETVGYDMEFEVPFDLSIDSVVAERRLFALKAYRAEKGAATGIQITAVRGGIVEPAATPARAGR